MASITGGVPLGGFVSPTDTEDTFAVTDPTYGLGGLRNVADTTARNAVMLPILLPEMLFLPSAANKVCWFLFRMN